MSSWSEAIKEAFATANVRVFVVDTLEVRQPGYIDSIYLVRGWTEWRAKDENGAPQVFEPVWFDFTLPPATEEGYTYLQVAFSNVGKRVSDFLRQALENPVPVEMVYRPYLSDNPEEPQMIPPLLLYLKDVQITSSQVTGRATFMDLINKAFPSQLYTRSRFPTLE